MEALLMEYAKKLGMEKAMNLLGLNQQQNNPLIFGLPDSLPFGPKKFNLLPTIARTGINAALKGGFSSAALPLALGAGILGLGYYRNPLREGSPNYNPNLQSQIDYLSANNLIGTDIGPGQGFTRYGPASVLQGKNVVSGFGTNDYRDMLNKYIADMQANEKISAAGKERKLRKAKKELADFELDQVNKKLAKQQAEKNKKLTNKMTTYQGAGDGSAFNQSSYDAGKASAVAQEQSNRDYARGRFGQGGLASLL
tara:strand:+ start:859 stop:1620 length:762 start_codon:yes stop_codon:yes gene_type:complete